VSERGGLRYDRYQVNGHYEWRMRIGPEDGVPILFLPPLFEEMNRTRALLAAAMRQLGHRGFRCTLPDLPGTGESERALESCGWDDWVEAARAADSPALVASFRGGALLDTAEAAARWRFAPVNGASLIRDLERTESAGSGANTSPRSSRAKSRGARDEFLPAPFDVARDARVQMGGYLIANTLVASVRSAEPAEAAPCRTVRLTSDPKPADAKLDGPALWRRSEPSTSSELTAAIASDIEGWARQCGIS
jgi:pimeloyl-ACP methyl ester carboxylesterase